MTAAGAVTYPLDGADGFARDVEAIAAAVDHEPVAFPCMDEWVVGFAETEPDGVRLPFSSLDVVDGILDKFALCERADALGVPYPETYRLDETDPADAADRLGYPFVVKPALKRELEEAIGTNVVEVTDDAASEEILDAAATHDVEDVLGSGEWAALASGAFEGSDALTTGIYRPSDPGPVVQARRARLSGREYYCSC